MTTNSSNFSFFVFVLSLCRLPPPPRWTRAITSHPIPVYLFSTHAQSLWCGCRLFLQAGCKKLQSKKKQASTLGVPRFSLLLVRCATTLLADSYRERCEGSFSRFLCRLFVVLCCAYCWLRRMEIENKSVFIYIIKLQVYCYTGINEKTGRK